MRGSMTRSGRTRPTLVLTHIRCSGRSWGKDHIAHSGRGGGTWGNGVRKKDIHKGAGPPTHARTAHAPSTRVRPKAAAPKVPAGALVRARTAAQCRGATRVARSTVPALRGSSPSPGGPAPRGRCLAWPVRHDSGLPRPLPLTPAPHERPTPTLHPPHWTPATNGPPSPRGPPDFWLEKSHSPTPPKRERPSACGGPAFTPPDAARRRRPPGHAVFGLRGPGQGMSPSRGSRRREGSAAKPAAVPGGARRGWGRAFHDPARPHGPRCQVHLRQGHAVRLLQRQEQCVGRRQGRQGSEAGVGRGADGEARGERAPNPQGLPLGGGGVQNGHNAPPVTLTTKSDDVRRASAGRHSRNAIGRGWAASSAVTASQWDCRARGAWTPTEHRPLRNCCRLPATRRPLTIGR